MEEAPQRAGVEGRFDYAAIGNVPNLAARICDVAQGDQILISQRVYSATKDIVEVDPIGDLTFKGIQRPNSVYNVLRVK